MEAAGRAVWRRCASDWRACCAGGVVPRLSSAAAPFCPVRCGAPRPVPRRASVSLCSEPRRASVSPCGEPRRASVSLCGEPRRASASPCSEPRRASVSLCSEPRRASVSPCGEPRRASVSLCSEPRRRSMPSYTSAPPCVVPLRLLSASPGSSLCWSCQSSLRGPRLFCPSCRCIQPPDESKDHYQLLDCDRSFNIDVQELQRKYRNLQRLLHPDYFSQKSQRERDISEKQSSMVNKAYNTLISPLSRGIYLLSLHGITIAEGTEGGVDAPFLFDILEINEKLNDLKNEAEIEEIGTFVQEKCQSLIENVRTAFEKGDLDDAKMLLAKMKYYSNILDQVKKKMIP